MDYEAMGSILSYPQCCHVEQGVSEYLSKVITNREKLTTTHTEQVLF